MLVRNIMVQNVVTIQEKDTLENAALLLQQGRFRHLPVVQRLPQQQGASTAQMVYPPRSRQWLSLVSSLTAICPAAGLALSRWSS